MDLTWLETTGRLSLLLFALLVAGLLFVGARRMLGRAGGPGPGRLERIDRFLLEYVGNLPLADLPAAGTIPVDERRRNGAARALFDAIIRELDRRRVPSFQRELFLEELRGAIVAEERLRAGGLEGREAERRFLEAQRWALAERFHAIVEDPPPDIVARIKSGLHASAGTAYHGPDADR